MALAVHLFKQMILKTRKEHTQNKQNVKLTTNMDLVKLVI